VVEDDDDVRQHSVETLRDLGYRVLEAHDGQAALSLLTKHKGHIALMFCDIGLPNGENGRELAQVARSAHPSLRVLYTSGSAEGVGIAGAEEDAEAVIPKPFTTANLAVRMREALERSASAEPPVEG
jgi:DNA-binding response OmpR family regulator